MAAMPRRTRSPLESLADVPAVREAARALLDAVAAEARGRALTPVAYDKAVRDLGRLRGRPLYYPLLLGRGGRGARVTLADGTVKLDFIGAIGVYVFGHADRDLLEVAVVAAAADEVHQGNLAPGPEILRLTKALLRHSGPHLKHAWLSISGSMANENALKILWQKQAPADRIVAFERGFAGRTSALAELSDRPGFREGLPLRGNALFVPFFDPEDPASTRNSVAALDAHLARWPGRVAAMLFELVLGEGGIDAAPREFFAALMERCRAAGVAVWVDEVQTFARTGELFAFRKLGLEDLVDVVSCGKALQGSAVLFRKSFNPRPGLLGGTYAGSTVGMAVGARIIERLESEGYLGPEGRVALLERRVARRFEALARVLPRAVGRRSGIGSMHAFVPFDGSPKVVSGVLEACFREGLLVFGAGTTPGKVRMLLPVNVTDEELEAGFTMLEKALRLVGEEQGLPC
jgi:acetylornithine/N-succinyldiaminopimelate aminotransferase